MKSVDVYGREAASDTDSVPANYQNLLITKNMYLNTRGYPESTSYSCFFIHTPNILQPLQLLLADMNERRNGRTADQFLFIFVVVDWFWLLEKM